MTNYLINGNSIHIPLPDQSVQCIITSPPYWALRSYLDNGDLNKHHEIGSEATPAAYVAHLVAVMRECWRVLRDDGTMWINLGDSYAGNNNGYSGDDRPSNKSGSISSKNNGEVVMGQRRRLGNGLKPKDLCGIPWRVAFALQDAGWYLRSDIIWSKPNPMPESVTDRPTKAHEYVFLLTKRAQYYYDAEAIKEKSENINGKPRPFGGMGGTAKGHNEDRNDYMYQGDNGFHNKRSVWEIATSPYSGAHYATFPPDLVRPMVLAGTSPRACETCGAPWERVIEREATNHKAREDRQIATGGAISGGVGKNFPDIKTNTTGWRPTCRCAVNTGSAHCLILDPFCGSGTVLEVAREAGRDAVGIDLSLKYFTDNAMPRALQTNTPHSMATLPLFAPQQDKDE